MSAHEPFRVARVDQAAIDAAIAEHVKPAMDELYAMLVPPPGAPEVNVLQFCSRLQVVLQDMLAVGMETAARGLQKHLAEQGYQIGLWFEDPDNPVNPDLN